MERRRGGGQDRGRHTQGTRLHGSLSSQAAAPHVALSPFSLPSSLSFSILSLSLHPTHTHFLPFLPLHTHTHLLLPLHRTHTPAHTLLLHTHAPFTPTYCPLACTFNTFLPAPHTPHPCPTHTPLHCHHPFPLAPYLPLDSDFSFPSSELDWGLPALASWWWACLPLLGWHFWRGRAPSLPSILIFSVNTHTLLKTGIVSGHLLLMKIAPSVFLFCYCKRH